MTFDFSSPKLWQFSGHVHFMVQPTPANKLPQPMRQLRAKTYGVVAKSFDSALVKLRSAVPEDQFRVQNVGMHDVPIDLIADDPVAHWVAASLE
ncbi:MAG: hypothetical protein RJA99_3236 [Pseudomonadota bacterium]|jgi:hypothetical protein